MTVAAPEACTNTTAKWTAIDNHDDEGDGEDNDGDERQGYTLDTASSVLSTTITDSCHLAFATEPTNAIVNQTISGTAYLQTGPAITVDVLYADGSLVTSSSAPITMSLNNNLSSATLGGTLTQNASGGVATFGGLSVSAGQDNYALGASDATDSAVGTSTSFNIAQQGTSCAGPCTGSSSTTGGSGKIVASPTTTGGTGTLVESVNVLGQAPLTCTGPAGYRPLDPNTYEYATAGSSTLFSKVITITIVNPAGAPSLLQLLNLRVSVPFGCPSASASRRRTRSRRSVVVRGCTRGCCRPARSSARRPGRATTA